MSDLEFGPSQSMGISKMITPKYPSLSLISEISDGAGQESKRQILEQQNGMETMRQSTRKKALVNDMTNQSIDKSLRQIVNHSLPMSSLKSNTFLSKLLSDRLVNRFIENLYTNSYLLSHTKRHKINEKTFFKKYENANYWDSAKQSSCFIPVLQPDSKILFAWDTIIILLSLVVLWTTPFLASFGHLIAELPTKFLTSLTVMMGIDIFFNFNRAVLVQGQIIRQRRKLARIYFKDFALVDCLQISAWILLYLTLSENGIYRILVTLVQHYVSYQKIQRNFTNHYESLYLKGNMCHILDLASLTVAIFFFAHVSACVFHYTSVLSEDGWLVYNELQNSDYWVKYNYSFYWSTMTMTTVGYGDITAKSQLELVAATVMMFFSTCVFAYSMSSIGIILKGFYDSKLKYRLTLMQINSYMNKNLVEAGIQNKVRNYLKYLIQEESNENVDNINQIISHLPNSLMLELTKEIQTKAIKNMKFLQANFSHQTLQSLAGSLDQVRFTPGEVIYHQGEKNAHSLYFVVEGQVELLELNSQLHLRTVSSNHCFGMVQFFTGGPPKMSARSKSFTTLFKIERERFLEILQFNRKDYEQFFHIKDSILFNRSYFQIERQCQFCSKYSHVEIDCPMIQYKPDLEQRMKKSQFTQEENKRVFKNRLRNKHSSRMDLNYVTESIKNYINIRSHVDLVSTDQIRLPQLKETQKSEISEPEEVENSQIQFLGRIDTSGNRVSIKVENGRTIIQQVDDPQSPQFRHSRLDISGSRRKITNQSTVLLRESTMLDEFRPRSQIHECNIDSIAVFQRYMPQNNIDKVIKSYLRYSKGRIKRLYNVLKQMDKYTFYHAVKMKALKLRMKLVQSRRSSRPL